MIQIKAADTENIVNKAEIEAKAEKLIALSQQAEELEKQIKTIKEYLLAEMENQNILNICDGIKDIQHIFQSLTYKIDSKKLKAEYPEVYKAVASEQVKKAYIRVSQVKGK